MMKVLKDSYSALAQGYIAEVKCRRPKYGPGQVMNVGHVKK
jgi:hypothetical protein